MLLLHNAHIPSEAKYSGYIPGLLKAGNVSPLAIAIITGNRESIAQIFAELQQTTINAQDNFGMTTLHWAAARNDEQTVNELLGRTTNVNIRDNGGNTPLRYAARSSYLDINAQVNLFNNKGASAWVLALRNNHTEIADLLERYAGQAVFGLVTRAGQVGELTNLPGGVNLPAEIAALVAHYAMAPGAAAPSGPSA